MKARCVYCKEMWPVSPYWIIPRKGYECPDCASERKRANGGGTPKGSYEYKQVNCIRNKEEKQ